MSSRHNAGLGPNATLDIIATRTENSRRKCSAIGIGQTVVVGNNGVRIAAHDLGGGQSARSGPRIALAFSCRRYRPGIWSACRPLLLQERTFADTATTGAGRQKMRIVISLN